jgi:hypothetical protein
VRLFEVHGAYLVDTSPPVFRCVAPPSEGELQALVQRIAERIGRALERVGLIMRDVEQSHLALEAEAGGPMDDLIGHSVTYRLAVGPRAGQKVFALQAVPAQGDAEPRKGVAPPFIRGPKSGSCKRPISRPSRPSNGLHTSFLGVSASSATACWPATTACCSTWAAV